MTKMDSQNIVGLILTIVGIILFIALMGDLLFRIIGSFGAVMLTNYGLQMQGLPTAPFYIMKLFKYRS